MDNVIDGGTLIILTGAGFSKNWGGLLTAELTERIAASQCLSHFPSVRLNFFEKGNYEEVLHEVRELGDKTEIHAAERATIEAYEFQESLFNTSSSISSLFGLSDLILDWYRQGGSVIWFTLNQDLLVESAYPVVSNSTFLVDESGPGVATYPPSLYLPGVAGGDEINRDMFGTNQRFVIGTDIEPTPLNSKRVPYIKLHGSMNWVTASGRPCLVYGRNKQSQVESDEMGLLLRYRDLLQARIPTANHVFVIGYSFGDGYVNEALSRTGRLHVFDTSGLQPLMGKLLQLRTLRWDSSWIGEERGVLTKTLNRVRSVWSKPINEVFDLGSPFLSELRKILDLT